MPPTTAEAGHSVSVFSAARRLIRIDCYSSSGKIMSLFDELEWRGMLYDSTDGLREQLATERLTA